MFSIRRVYDTTLKIDRDAMEQVRSILRAQFSGIPAKEIDELDNKLTDPLKYRFRTILFVAEKQRHEVRGFAILNHAPDLNFCYLDYISVEPGGSADGVGGALYARVKEEARALGTIGIFMECLPDESSLCRDPVTLKQNRARLKFYERFGALPIINTAYETPLVTGGDCPPYLVFDGLKQGKTLGRQKARAIVKAILDRKYGPACPPGYIAMVVASFRDNPVKLRPPRYTLNEQPHSSPFIALDRRIPLVVNEKHEIHHVRERGYVESPVRIKSILKGIEPTGLFDRKPARHFSESHIKKVHDPHFIEYLKRVCTNMEPGKSVYPYVFPIRNVARPPKELPVRAGYYCIDTFTPLNHNAYLAAKGAVDCALTGAAQLLEGYRLAYSLVRPPGHHAERKVFGGFCYFNSAAIAADHLSSLGKVAVLDVDYHHGNGTQDIFYERSDVLTISIHGHPSFAYPYFSGFSEELGNGPGQGFNRNYPLTEKVAGEAYRKTLERALNRIRRFQPKFLVVALGFDTAKKDPTGTWSLVATDLEKNGHMIGALGLPTLVVQEGGYRTNSLGANARNFFQGLWKGAQTPGTNGGKKPAGKNGMPAPAGGNKKPVGRT
ncbi:MAG TPA: histone deacetylase family protein [Desulfurivibrionaceae bacterium]|nr:histone deacetylase family protein [Desulfurivibrionaceae bacterium]